MKKIGLSILAASLISTAVAAMPAKQPNMQAYHGGYTALASKKSLNSFYPMTDISIINASDNMIRITIPNTPVQDWLYVNASPYHVTHTGGSFYTNLLIQDSSYNTIFNQTVCPRALVTIFGSYGHYTWNVDEEYCH